MQSKSFNIKCPYCQQKAINRDGFFFRQDDSKQVQRYRCKNCGRRFSRSTFSFEYRQQKRRVNYQLMYALCSKVSIRRAALMFHLDKNTVLSRIRSMAHKARYNNELFMQQYLKQPVNYMQMDDLVTKEQTKLKPLSVTIAIDVDRKYILAMKVSKIAAFGHLAKIAVKKYGKRISNYNQIADALVKSLKPFIAPHALVETDEHRSYPIFFKKYLPEIEHLSYKGEKACVVGQGEMKKNGQDPLFYINHTCAMLRDNLARLLRRSWCLSQKAEMLQNHLDIFTYFYNQIYLAK